MAYTNYEFYRMAYFGDLIPDDDFCKVAERASDFIDVITFDRLEDGLPSKERDRVKVQKAVCAVAEIMYQMELAERQALIVARSQAEASDTQNGNHSGVITSVSAGSESISYASPSQMASGAKEWSAIYSAVGNKKTTNTLLYDAAREYLSGVCNNTGIPLLYAGM